MYRHPYTFRHLSFAPLPTLYLFRPNTPCVGFEVKQTVILLCARANGVMQTGGHIDTDIVM